MTFIASPSAPRSGAHPPTVSLEIDSGLARLCLDSPANRNALDGRNIEQLMAAIDQVARTPSVQVLLICARGAMFCPGADMGWLRPAEAGFSERIESLLAPFNAALERLRTLPAIVVTAVHGSVAGGGLGLMNVADLVLAAGNTKFSLAYSRIGATPDLGASFYLPRLLGERRAMELLLLSEPFDAQRAVEIGLVNFVVPPERFDEKTDALVKRLLGGPPQALSAIKRLVYGAHEVSLHDQLAREADCLVAATRGTEFREGIRAFLAKQAPNFASPQQQVPS